MTELSPGWYLRRLSKMSPAEVTSRAVDKTRQQLWRRRQVLSYGGEPVDAPWASLPPGGQQPCFHATLPTEPAALIPIPSVRSILDAADEILSGKWSVLGVARGDLHAPDWFHDPITGVRAPQKDYCFSINYRSEAVTGNIKQVWELSRLQHVTLLSCAYSVSGSEQYARTAADHLRSWWAENPFLSGVHWTSGIELGIRLISWAWTRRLLDPWPGVQDLFERNQLARAQIWWHQTYLDAFRSQGSSANNHVIAEAAGQLVGALAFPWFPESARWAGRAVRVLEGELEKNTFPSGVNREMAFEYHGFVAELGLAAAVEAERAGQPLGAATKAVLCRMLDVIAACVDEKLCPPRYGDGDDGRGFLLGDPGANRWATLLAIGRALFGAPEWWPQVPPDVASSLFAALGGGGWGAGLPRLSERPDAFSDAGVVILRTRSGAEPEIWCRCDGGPHGFLSIAAHAHADALAIEVRHGGVDVLADPGTYCYHGETRWRRYFRSTLAHNTLEVGGQDQSESGGAFLWRRHAEVATIDLSVGQGSDTAWWYAQQDGYLRLDPPLRHRRRVRLMRASRRLEIIDELDASGEHLLRLAFHLGPTVDSWLDDHTAYLSWSSAEGRPASATLQLPDILDWSAVRGSEDPPLGWYSHGFGQKEPATTLLGAGRAGHQHHLRTVLTFHD